MLYFFAPILMNCVESIFSYMLYGIKSYWRSFEIILELGANGKQTNTTHWQENLVRVFNFRGSPTLQQHFKAKTFQTPNKTKRNPRDEKGKLFLRNYGMFSGNKMPSLSYFRVPD